MYNKERLLSTVWMSLITIGVVAGGNSDFRADRRTVLGGYFCEKNVMRLNCTDSKVLEIQEADYRGGTPFVCGHGERADETCAIVDKSQMMKRSCDNRRACSITVIRDIFGNHCHGNSTYLFVLYACVAPIKRRKSTTITPTPPKTTEVKPEISPMILNLTQQTTTSKPNATANQTTSTNIVHMTTTRKPSKRLGPPTKKGKDNTKIIPVFDPAKSEDPKAMTDVGTSKHSSVVMLAWVYGVTVFWIWWLTRF